MESKIFENLDLMSFDPKKLSIENLIEIFNQKSNNTDDIPEIEVWCSQIDEMF